MNTQAMYYIWINESGECTTIQAENDVTAIRKYWDLVSDENSSISGIGTLITPDGRVALQG